MFIRGSFRVNVLPTRRSKSANGCLQQIAANRFSTPQDIIAILLQGFVRPYVAALNTISRTADIFQTRQRSDWSFTRPL
jgi:hypothetical protein